MLAYWTYDIIRDDIMSDVRMSDIIMFHVIISDLKKIKKNNIRRTNNKLTEISPKKKVSKYECKTNF